MSKCGACGQSPCIEGQACRHPECIALCRAHGRPSLVVGEVTTHTDDESLCGEYRPNGEPTRHEWLRVCVYHHVEHPDPRQVRDWLSNDNELNLSWTCGCVLQVRKVMPVG